MINIKNIEDSDEFEKTQYRWKTKPDLLYYQNEYLHSNCDTITHETFDQDLTNIFGVVELDNREGEKQEFIIHPNCSEISQATPLDYVSTSISSTNFIDLVNRPMLKKTTADILQNKFNIQITPGWYIEEGDTFFISPRNRKTDPQDFLIYLSARLRDRPDDPDAKFSKSNVFIATHSNFMRNLYIHINKSINPQYMESTNKGIFDNLDIFHLIFNKDKDETQFTHAFVRRYANDYSIVNEDGFIFDKSKHCSVILMRHCFACHNVTDYRIVKAQQYFKNKVGHLSLSTCFDYTLVEMYNKRDRLIEIFNRYGGGVDNYIFGSSIILRAILTSILQKYVLDNETDNKTKPEL